MPPLKIWIPLLIAVLDWLTIYFRWRLLGYFTKPGFILALLLCLWFASGFRGPIQLVGVALFFSLIGDMILMVPGKPFILAVFSFSLAHLAYIIALNPTLPTINLSLIVIMLVIAITIVPIIRSITNGLRVNKKEKMIPFLWAYSGLLAMMLLSAMLTLVRPEWQNMPALIISAGALLFFLSDTLLAFHNFITPITHGQLKVRVSYHLGQAAIVTGFTFQFLS